MSTVRRAMVGLLLGSVAGTSGLAREPGSVIFIHPDGTSLQGWNAFRLVGPGPDGDLNWDKLPAIGLYRCHMTDHVCASSHGGGTIHAYGVKVPLDSYGMMGDAPLMSASRKPFSILVEAQKAGKAIGVVNTGHIAEPGTGVFLASSTRRDAYEDITRQILKSGAEVIMAGGEMYMMPEGVVGRHGQPGTRTDGTNWIVEMQKRGYAVVFNRAELQSLPAETEKVFGVFAASHTFHDEPEESLRAKRLPHYKNDAPTFAEMVDAALKVLGRRSEGFLLVAEEEGTDNFGNKNNASGMFHAYRRADAGIGVALDFVTKHTNTLLLTAADSDASGMQVMSFGLLGDRDPTDLEPLQDDVTDQGAPLDGVDGAGTAPFVSEPDAAGRRHVFAVTWPTRGDVPGAVVVRGAGRGSERVRGSVDNTAIFGIMWEALFGEAGERP